MTATATPEFHQFFAVDRDDDQNRAMVVYHAMEHGEFKPLRHIMNVETGTRYVSANELGYNEVALHDLTFEEQVDEYFDSAIFTISNEADDRAMMAGCTYDAFNDFLNAMCEVEWGLTQYGFKWYHCTTAEEAREAMDMRGAMIIEATENGVCVFRG